MQKIFKALPLLRRSPLLSPCTRTFHKKMDMDALQKSIAAAMQSALQPVLKRLEKLEEIKLDEPKCAQKTPENKHVVGIKKEKKRQSTPKAKAELRNRVRDTIMKLIDAPLLAPQHATELYQAKTYLGKTIGQFTLNRGFFLIILNHVLDELEIDATAQTSRIVTQLVTKRRQYHQQSWKEDNKCKNLKYGGQLGVMSDKLVDLYNQSLSKATGETQKAKKTKKRTHKGTPKKQTPNKK